MFKFSVIFLAMVISMVMADPNLYNQGQWNQFQIQPGFNSHDNRPPIDWNQFGNEGNNDLIGHHSHPHDDWNKYPNGNSNGFDSHQNQWNYLPNNGENDIFNSHPNQHPNQWNNYPNEVNHNQIGFENGSANNKFTDCGPTNVWKDVPGMQWWCRANCFHVPSFCPSSHCRCW